MDKLDEMTPARKWDDVTPQGLDTIIEYLKCNHNPEMARQVIELFHERMRDGEHVDYEALSILTMNAFSKIVGGMSADEAFGLKAGKGKYDRADTLERDVRAATLVVWHMRQGATWEDAITDTAEHMKLTSITVQRAYDKFRTGSEYLLDEQLEPLAMACM
ncbi:MULTISPECIES: hypothetical protein [Aeromonas]|uniref:hypothetical protein n=1 Tax=Aeromonas TaxID=642 RepID=UPI00227DF725|nr:hypothetical protein [Aeromonas media]MCY9821599.1 hypothetical protein [Aeromonas media]